jgi:hypothetical protein
LRGPWQPVLAAQGRSLAELRPMHRGARQAGGQLPGPPRRAEQKKGQA